MKKYTFLVLSFLFISSSYAQKELTLKAWLEDGEFSQSSVRNVNWMNDGGYYSALENNNILKYNLATGKAEETILDGSSLDEEIKIDQYSFSASEEKLLLQTERTSIYRRSFTAEYYVYNLSDESLVKLSNGGKQSYATFSPDGSKVAFVRDNNLFYVELDGMSEKQLTSDGAFNSIINGSTDWVYEEELYLTKAFEWSPEGDKIAYYKFDESGVKEYNMQVWSPNDLYPTDYRYKYPKAGESNSTVDIFIYNLNDEKTIKADIGNGTDIYIPKIKWTGDNNILSIRRLNRLQNEMDILHCDAQSGSTELILKEKAKEYIESHEEENLIYLKDGKHFIFTSDRDGYNHVYLYTNEGELVRQITKGEWEIATFLGVDQKGKKATIYFVSTEGSPLERYFFSIDISGKNKIQLTKEQGTHRIDISDDFSYYIDYYSSATQPLKVSLYKTKGNKLVEVLKDNSALIEKSKEYDLVEKEFFSFETSEGIQLNGYFLKPSDFDPSKKYPVLIYQYSGPGSQQVLNNWTGGHYYYHQLLTKKGYIVATVDPRGTGGRGSEFTKVTYQQLGKYESNDHIETAKYLGSLDFIDAGRIGIWGWSYGGYISSLSMFKGEGIFKTAVAVAPVTTWRFYDTIYTERYLRKPQDNPSGYDDNSPINHVDKLKGNYLLIHGTGDDNVHFQNAVALENALINEGKQFETFYYPDRAHSLWGPDRRMHLYEMMTNYIVENL
ncbi:MAG: S9 family peptidase [Bacteroidota bacterium]